MSVSTTSRALPALIFGAILIGLAPIFVRVSGLGPNTAAFWRLALALPVLGLLLWRRRRDDASAPALRAYGGLWLSGLFFAADLALWHQSIRWTSVANATLLANLAPVFVTLLAWKLYGERVSSRFVLGLLLALIGAGTLLADSLRVGAETVLGDGMGIGAAVFYAGYLLGVSRQRRRFDTLQVMFWTTAAGAVVLLPLTLASGETIWPPTANAWGCVIGMALLSHVGGQGLIAYALAHLPAALSSVSLLIQPVAAALFAWVLLSEAFGLQQGIGGLIVLAGILLCRLAMLRSHRPLAGTSPTP